MIIFVGYRVKSHVAISKNYLNEDELAALSGINAKRRDGVDTCFPGSFTVFLRGLTCPDEPCKF